MLISILHLGWWTFYPFYPWFFLNYHIVNLRIVFSENFNPIPEPHPPLDGVDRFEARLQLGYLYICLLGQRPNVTVLIFGCVDESRTHFTLAYETS